MLADQNKTNLFIIGAMKSGTTSLHEYLSSHRDICMSTIKEPGYFVESMTWKKGLGWYHSIFEDFDQQPYIGESSTHYTKQPYYADVAERIFNYNPKAKLIYLVRDPFERLQSHYWHACRQNSKHAEGRSFYDAVTSNNFDNKYVHFSNYGMQLNAYLATFPRDSIRIYLFENFISQPENVINDILDWLELSHMDLDNMRFEQHNSKPKAFNRATNARFLRRIQYSNTWDKIAPLVPTALKKTARKLTSKPSQGKNANHDLEKAYHALQPVFKQQHAEFHQLTGIDVSGHWPSLEAEHYQSYLNLKNNTKAS